METQRNSDETGKRYDVYCSEGDQRVVVYRNALFTDTMKVSKTVPHSLRTMFLDLEQENGQTVCVPARSIIKFCEPGTEIVSEIMPSK